MANRFATFQEALDWLNQYHGQLALAPVGVQGLSIEVNLYGYKVAVIFDREDVELPERILRAMNHLVATMGHEPTKPTYSPGDQRGCVKRCYVCGALLEAIQTHTGIHYTPHRQVHPNPN